MKTKLIAVIDEATDATVLNLAQQISQAMNKNPGTAVALLLGAPPAIQAGIWRSLISQAQHLDKFWYLAQITLTQNNPGGSESVISQINQIVDQIFDHYITRTTSDTGWGASIPPENGVLFAAYLRTLANAIYTASTDPINDAIMTSASNHIQAKFTTMARILRLSPEAETNLLQRFNPALRQQGDNLIDTLQANKNNPETMQALIAQGRTDVLDYAWSRMTTEYTLHSVFEATVAACTRLDARSEPMQRQTHINLLNHLMDIIFESYRNNILIAKESNPGAYQQAERAKVFLSEYLQVLANAILVMPEGTGDRIMASVLPNLRERINSIQKQENLQLDQGNFNEINTAFDLEARRDFITNRQH